MNAEQSLFGCLRFAHLCGQGVEIQEHKAGEFTHVLGCLGAGVLAFVRCAVAVKTKLVSPVLKVLGESALLGHLVYALFKFPGLNAGGEVFKGKFKGAPECGGCTGGRYFEDVAAFFERQCHSVGQVFRDVCFFRPWVDGLHLNFLGYVTRYVDGVGVCVALRDKHDGFSAFVAGQQCVPAARVLVALDGVVGREAGVVCPAVRAVVCEGCHV